jgi:hypothetical protein
MLSTQLPAYPYEQYADDPDIRAFFDAYCGTNGAGTSLNPAIAIIAMSITNGVRSVQSQEPLGYEIGSTFLATISGALPAIWNTPGITLMTVIADDTFTFTDTVFHVGPPTAFGTWTIQPAQDNAQGYLDDINALNLPVYTEQSGALLDWVGNSLYDEPRQNLATGLPIEIGPINTYGINTFVIDGALIEGVSGVVSVSDAAYQSILMWNNYKGDGYQFTIRWLKRRVLRFLAGLFNYDGIITPDPDQTYQVSVAFTSDTAVAITVNAGKYPLTLKPVLAAAITNGTLLLPLQYTFTVV